MTREKKINHIHELGIIQKHNSLIFVYILSVDTRYVGG